MIVLITLAKSISLCFMIYVLSNVLSSPRMTTRHKLLITIFYMIIITVIII